MKNSTQKPCDCRESYISKSLSTSFASVVNVEKFFIESYIYRKSMYNSFCRVYIMNL